MLKIYCTKEKCWVNKTEGVGVDLVSWEVSDHRKYAEIADKIFFNELVSSVLLILKHFDLINLGIGNKEQRRNRQQHDVTEPLLLHSFSTP